MMSGRRKVAGVLALMVLALLTIALVLLQPVSAESRHAAAQERLPVAHYAFEDITGRDEQADAENLTIVGAPSLTAGVTGNAWALDGKSGALRTETPDLSGDFTLELDFKADANPAGTQVLAGKSNYNGKDKREWTLAVATDAGAKRMYIIFNAWNTQTEGWDALSAFLDTGVYHHVVLEVQNNTANLYVDGGCVGGVTFAERRNTVAQFTIGCGINGSATQQYFVGSIDELKLYTGVQPREDAMQESLSQEALLMRYNFERSSNDLIRDASGQNNHAALYPALRKSTATTSRVEGGYRENGMYLNGKSIIDTGYSLNAGEDFSVSLYFKAETLTEEDHTLFGQTNYASGQREFAVYFTSNRNLRLNAWVDGKWSSAIVGEVGVGQWYHFALSVKGGVATGWLNGFEAFNLDIGRMSSNSGATFTVGGVISGSNIYQAFNGHVDEVRVYTRALTGEEVWASLNDDIQKEQRTVQHAAESAMHDDVTLIPSAAIDFISIQKSDPNGYKWQHGAAIARYHDKFYAVWGRNVGAENTAGEECVCYVSDDGVTWKYLATLGDAVEGYGYSHGTVFVHEDVLYVLAPFYAGSDKASSVGIRFRDLSMRGFAYDEQTGWRQLEMDCADFWPLQEPQKMADGNYIMAGVDADWRAAVAISSGDMTKWEVVEIPQLATGFTESNLVVDGNKVTLYMRNEKAFLAGKITIGVSYSEDCGRTWTFAQETDMDACTSKPCTGVLSTGERYLITNAVRGAGTSRNTLTLALSASGGEVFERLYVIRDMEIPASLKEAYSENSLNLALSYPSAMEYDGKLYVVYSSYAAGGNQNHIELAVIDLAWFTARERAASFAAQHEATLTAEQPDGQAVTLVKQAYDALDGMVQAELGAIGFAAKLTGALNAVEAEQTKVRAEEVEAQLLAAIEGATAATLVQVQAQVRTLWEQTTSAQRALMQEQTIALVETFLAM